MDANLIVLCVVRLLRTLQEALGKGQKWKSGQIQCATTLRAGQIFWYRARLIDRIGNQSDWTEWVRGMANDNADDYLGEIAKDFLTSEDGERLSSQIDTNIEGMLQNALNSNSSVDHQFKMQGEIRAYVLTVKTTVANLDKAFAEQTTLVSAQFQSVDGKLQTIGNQLLINTAAIEQKMTSVSSGSGGSAIYSMKAGVNLNGNYYDAGMTIAVLAPTGQPVTTRIGFNANQFVVMSGSGGNAYSPFAIANGQVFISDAFIRDASIDNTKIGSFIQSSNWDGNNGWHINKNGTATFRNIDIYGAVQGQGSMSITSSTLTIRDGNGDIKVKLGYLG